MRRGKLPLHVKAVRAKGRTYLYFDTGTLNERGRPVRAPLPPLGDPAFGDIYAALMAGRTRRAARAAVLSVPQMVDLFQRSQEYRDLAAGTRKVYDIYLRRFADQLAPAPAGEVERRDIVLLMDRMGETPGAANSLMRTVGALYAWARQRGHVTNEPCKDIAPRRIGEHEPWPIELLDAALVADDRTIRLAVSLLYYTAQRIGDVCKIRWSDVRDGIVHVHQQKVRTRKLDIRLHRNLAALLADTSKAGMTILSALDGRPVKPDTLRLHIQAFAADRGFGRVVPHGLRKNAVNALLEAGCTVAETSAVTGQSLQQVEHYAKRRATGALASSAILKMERGKA